MRPNIVVLDGYTLAPTPNQQPRNDWAPIQELGSLTVHDRSTEKQATLRAASATIVLSNKTPLSAKTIDALPELRYIGVLATGVNNIDLLAASRRNITVTNVPHYGSDSVAQHTFALLLELACRTGDHDRAVHDGQWSRCPDFCFTLAPLTELAGKTIGLIGLGDIGRRVAQIAHAFAMRVVVTKQTPAPHPDDPPVEYLPLEQLLRESDVVSLHCPLTEKTHHLINTDRLSLMKSSAILINTARGPLIDEPALAQALHSGHIAAAALDVLSTEPPPPDNPMLKAPNCLITPHSAWATTEAKQRMMHLAANNIAAFLDGKPINVVNPANP